MSEQPESGMIHKLARFGPLVAAGSAGLVLLHAAIYAVLKRGLLGQTDSFVIMAPVILYFLAAVAMLVLLITLCLKRRISAVWYFVSLLVCLGGLVMAVAELDHFMEVT